MIIDLANLNNSISVLVPGQSGNPASSHYRDQVDDWSHSRYHPMLIDRIEIKEAFKTPFGASPCPKETLVYIS